METKGFGNRGLLLDGLHVWSAVGLGGSQEDVFWPLLSLDEQERVLRFHPVARGQQFIASRGLLRLLLGRYLGQTPQSIQFQYSENGKPTLRWEEGLPPVNFNVTHSQDRVLYGFSLGVPVGIDLEWIDPALNPIKVARRICSDQEWQGFSQLLPEQQGAFFKLWTRKEAIIKLQGDRLFKGLKTYDVSQTLTAEGGWVDGEKGKNWVQDLSLWPDFAAAIAMPSPPQHITHYEWDGTV